MKVSVMDVVKFITSEFDEVAVNEDPDVAWAQGVCDGLRLAGVIDEDIHKRVLTWMEKELQ
jgi:hypothetical protein